MPTTKLRSGHYSTLDFLEALDGNPDEKDQAKRGWCEIKMMLEGDNCQALQTLINNNTISAEGQHTPTLALNAIQTVIKEDVHFWHYCDEILSELSQLPDEGIHSLNTCITTLVNKSKFTHEDTRETLKIIILQHVVKYHEARDWICLQNQNTLTYQSLLTHCEQLEQHCKQFQKAKAHGRAELTRLFAASATTYSLHRYSHLLKSHMLLLWLFPPLCKLPCLSLHSFMQEASDQQISQQQLQQATLRQQSQVPEIQ